MTIKKLKEMIENLPDDMRVCADNGKFLFEDNSEFVCIASDTEYNNIAVFQTKEDIDVGEELRGMAEVAIDEGWGDEQFYSEAVERGFVADDFPDPDVAEENMKYYGLI